MTGRTLSRGAGGSYTAARVVVELEHGITVYPPEADGDPWRAVFTENGQRRYRQGTTEAKLAAKLEKVRERLAACAPNMELPGSGLIAHYLDPDRLPAGDRWSRKHAHTQRRLCERFAAPVIAAVTCQDITTAHMQQIVNAAPTPGEGDRVQRMISALVTAGIDGGYLLEARRHRRLPHGRARHLPHHARHVRRHHRRRPRPRPHRHPISRGAGTTSSAPRGSPRSRA
jgi:hypothetical protein